MAGLLYRLGRFSFRHRRIVLVLWIALLAAFGVGAATLSQSTTDTFSLPGTEAQQGFDLLDERFPGLSADGATAQVVFAAPEGKVTDPQYRSAIDSSVAELGRAPDVASVRDPFQGGGVSPDGSIAYAEVRYDLQPDELGDPAREALTTVAANGERAGLQVEVGGTAVQPHPEPPTTEVIGLAVAVVVLTAALGSLLAAGLPLLTALIGVGIGISGVAISTAFFELSSTTSILALMLGLAVAIDYALFIVTRYQHELTVTDDPERAAGRAVGTAGNAVVFAGATVIVALVALSMAGIPMLTAMGLAAAGTVAVAVLIALTLLPAMLGFAGRRAAARRPRRSRGTGLGKRWVTFVTRRPVPVLLIAVLALGVAAVPATDLRLGMPDGGTAPPESTERKAYDLLSEGFGPGFNGPLLVVADLEQGQDAQRTAQALRGDLADLGGVARVGPPMVDPAGETAVLNVIPASSPSSPETEQLVRDIRAHGQDFGSERGAEVFVTGQTAMDIDTSDRLSDALLPYLAVVVGLAFLLLMVVFRSVVVPIKAAAGFLLTIGATFGAVVAVFQWGWLDWLFGVEQTAPIMSLLPIFMIGVLFGLAMDYQVFLVTRMREAHVHGAEPTEAVVGGFRHGSRVITAAALIMISVFAGFIASDEDTVKSVGLALAFGVLVDAFVVRMTIVPAVMSLLGRASWWLPRWLGRLLPRVDVEGASLPDDSAEREPGVSAAVR
ncbi:putative RND superfamily drug exporter [Saccharomonospora marina XMU15]|uniref:Putative RND superfamily drug exporter n=1 Tax=Saccharomonospora marina XMU15 TaxID=882083 RepID=H5WYS1_9PSEU|nr:MMPL family transporter [Saccharomonospora marina]EHR51793.1 putative RND superfamily drug exporter [Saccharomonospora marina XMU15]